MSGVAERGPPPELLALVAVRRRMVRPIDLSTIDDLVEAEDDVLVGHHQSNLQVLAAGTAEMRDTTLAFEEPAAQAISVGTAIQTIVTREAVPVYWLKRTARRGLGWARVPGHPR